MIIDITELNQNMKDEILIDSDIIFNEEQLESSEIKNLKNVHLAGTIFLNEESDACINGTLTGQMIIEDSISLEEVEYPFSIEIDEKIEKNIENFENTLDILDVLWQNIVLEVPLRFTSVNDYSKFKGEGWKLLSEEDVKTSNNPFEDLKSMFGKE